MSIGRKALNGILGIDIFSIGFGMATKGRAMKKQILLMACAALLGAVLQSSHAPVQAGIQLSQIEALGKKLFFDANLSVPQGQGCSACHGPAVGFTGPDENVNRTGGIYEGAVEGRFGNRKPPSAAYAGWSPRFHRDADGQFVGGMFWDGRATGEDLGDPLAEQAMGPFLNPLEQNMPDKKSVVLRLRKSDYAELFEEVWGKDSLGDGGGADKAYERIVRSIAAYERSAEVNPFSSKFDHFWRAVMDKGLDLGTLSATNASKFRGLGLSERELLGLVLFKTKGLCANCHVLTSESGNPPVFTDYTYDNLGLPVNPENPFYGQAAEYNPDGKKWLDPGLGGFLETLDKYRPYAAAQRGKHKVPTLRNVDKRPSPGFVKAFMHNGCFLSLEEVVHFYNTRDVPGAGWAAPEIPANVNRSEMGNLGLTGDEENAIVDFMKALTDHR